MSTQQRGGSLSSAVSKYLGSYTVSGGQITLRAGNDMHGSFLSEWRDLVVRFESLKGGVAAYNNGAGHGQCGREPDDKQSRQPER